MTNDVAIIGVGLHPFGRFEGKSGMEMGVDAIFSAVADAGIEWSDIQFATGGSWTVANPDAIVGMVGLSVFLSPTFSTPAQRRPAQPRHVPTESGWETTTSASPSDWTNIRAAPLPRIRRW